MADITIPAGADGSFKAYVAMPAKLPAPALIVIQEIFGVNAEMRGKCDEFAAKGYIAVCPDLFWRLQPGVQLTDQTKEEWDRAFDLMNRFDIDKGVEDLRSTAHVFKGHADCTGVVGCVGYCLGGRLAFLMAARTKIDCAVSYYGVGLEKLLGEAKDIKKPILLHIAEKDKFSTSQARNQLVKGLEDHKGASLYIYPGADHAFARKGGEHYDAQAADLANARTAAFLNETLRKAA